MADAYDETLETDGELSNPPARRDIFKNSSNTLHPKVQEQDKYNDPGYMSLSPHTSLGEPAIVCTLKSIPEKAPIQCSDSGEATELTTRSSDYHLGVDLDKLTLSTEDDEGISSYISASGQSLENLNVIESGDIEIDLFERDADGDTLVHLAIVQLAVDLSIVLIDLVEDTECLDIQNELFQTPLHLAVLTGQPDIAKHLVAKGADVTLRDKQGNTPLHIACRMGNDAAVRIIVESFGDKIKSQKSYFDTNNCEGLSCLHLAAQNKEYDIMGYLFAKGANVNIGDAKSGRTMLHHAVERKDIETVISLLTHADIDVDSKTYKGETPLVLAYWRNYQDIVKRLKMKGAYFDYDLFEESDDETT